MHDKYRVVLAFRCRDQAVVVPHTGRDQPVWEGDSVGVLIDADRSGENIRAVYVSPSNDLTDLNLVRVGADGDPGQWRANALWDDMTLHSGAARTAEVDPATGRTNQVWTVELAIPLRAVTRHQPEIAEGREWRVQLIRTNARQEAAEPVEVNLWSPARLYFKPSTYGRLRFH